MKKNYITGFVTGSLVFGAVGVLAGQYIATENPFAIQLNGSSVNIEGYNIDGSTYFKLRDISNVIGSFDVAFNNDIIQISKNGYVYEQNNIINSMSEHQRYMINIFLSNFSEIDFGDYNVNNVSRDQLIYFGCLHNSRNHTNGAISISDEEASKHVTLDDFIHACYKTSEDVVSNSIERYLGKSVEHGTAAHNTTFGYKWQFGYSNGYYYYDSGEEGDASRTFSIADSMYDNGDGTYTVKFSDYSSGYMEILNNCYNLTADDVLNYGNKIYKGKSGTAIVKPYVYNGDETYQLTSLQY